MTKIEIAKALAEGKSLSTTFIEFAETFDCPWEQLCEDERNFLLSVAKQIEDFLRLS